MSGGREIKTGSVISGFFRVTVAIILALSQLLVIVLFVQLLHEFATFAYLAMQIIGFICIIRLINRETSMTSKLAWSILVLTVPVVGVFMYLLWGGNIQGKHQILKQAPPVTEPDEEAIRSGEAVSRLEKEYPTWGRIGRYLNREGFLLYEATATRHFPSGEEMLESLIHDMEGAQQYILLQFFIVAEGRIWSRIEEILLRKASQGVEIKVLMDDFGSILRFSDEAAARLRKEGIQVAVFNPVLKYISRLYLNYRNHQKVAVVDGNIAYTGGVNIGDEYANLIRRFGYWKDTAVRLKGPGAWGLTKIFLQMWRMSGGQLPKGYDAYRPPAGGGGAGYCQPFSDGPLNNPDNPAESVYMQMISNARRYVYITTPYFAVEEGMLDTLCIAAESGVDVRLLLPAIPDKWYTYLVAESYFGTLISRGVKVYEYSPGFLHAKLIVCDGEAAVEGSINMDYRSFRMHYECGAWMCGTPAVPAITEDIRKTLEQSREISLEEWKKRPWYRKIMQQVLRVFAIFM
ncbi:cardiolipin synthase [Papillibacter cinnamivorans]|uniref:Cardiolipin synthase n=1 Tax=Papillibacter cinnamivorans DSM 12816 TaxID=1122930 RepID=A0A1W1ZE84_9FIRM|nr:cardiolipin synthase [Papillibacter cinnamivorans]SMC46328.1 cardiolipin synthase [Papillibacter cinnamivorans DSM 12816]